MIEISICSGCLGFVFFDVVLLFFVVIVGMVMMENVKVVVLKMWFSFGRCMFLFIC